MQQRDISPTALSDDTGIGSDGSDQQQRNQNVNQNQLIEMDDNNIEIRPPKQDLYSRVQRMDLPSLDLTKYLSQEDCPYDIQLTTKAADKKDCSIQAPRPLPLHWPNTREQLYDEIQKLDNQLLLESFISKPVDWMISKNLTSIPQCQKCKRPMVLLSDDKTAKWRCPMNCIDVFIIVQRPMCFKGLEHVGLMRILYSLYYWSICAPLDIVAEKLQLKMSQLLTVWKRIQKVCKVALEKSFPRFKLFHNPEGISGSTQPIELMYIVFNKDYIICGKHPCQNGVHLAQIKERDKVAEATQSWFAHGASIRICQAPFLELGKLREDLNISMAPLSQMVHKDGGPDLDSAFGYLVNFITNTLKEFDSSTATSDLMKHIIYEAEWREQYGKKPLEAFKNIVEHVSAYSKLNTHTILPVAAEKLGDNISVHVEEQQRRALKKKHLELVETYVEKFYYATVEPIDEGGDVKRKYKPASNVDNEQQVACSNVMFTCHLCRLRFESFDFTLHLIAHVDLEFRDKDNVQNGEPVECKHCFKCFKENELEFHKELLKMDLQKMKNGCRICCQQFKDESEYLEHMKKLHFKHDTPYRCAKCPFASSFQRDVFVHYHEEHSDEYVVFCTICLRSFTLSKPDELNANTLKLASEQIYKHIKEHYQARHPCGHCCLSFCSEGKLKKHKKHDHNPSNEDRVLENKTKLEAFIVDPREEPFCVVTRLKDLEDAHQVFVVEAARNKAKRTPPVDTPMVLDNQEQQQQVAVVEREETSNELALRDVASSSLETEMIISCLATLRQMDDILPNDSVLLSPDGLPIKCAECLQYVTIYHYLSLIRCQLCSYVTHCQDASENHQAIQHPAARP